MPKYKVEIEKPEHRPMVEDPVIWLNIKVETKPTIYNTIGSIGFLDFHHKDFKKDCINKVKSTLEKFLR